MVHDTCKYHDHDCIFPALYRAFGFWYHAGYNGIYLIHPRKVFHPLSIVGIILLVPGTQCLSTYLVSFTASLFPQWMKAYEN